MTQVSRNSRTSLSTTASENKYFYLTNSNYYSYSNIYICLEDNGYGLSYDNIKYCSTSTNPNSSPESAINGCFFFTISYYTIQISSGTTKYYYKISNNKSYSYSIVYYEGSYSSGTFYVTSDYKDLAPTIKMTPVSRNSRASLSTSSNYNKYFYLTNSNYYSHSSNIYICLEDKNFGLFLNSIRYCNTNTKPSTSADSVVIGCSFTTISYYNIQISSDRTKYYYQIPTSSSYNYSTFYYAGNYSSGTFYVTSNYKDLAPNVVMTQVSRNSRASLPTISSYSKYFYLTNSNYYSYSKNIYICLEDNGYGLSYDNIKYCHTYTNPNSYPDSAINGCSFSTLSYYSSKSYSGTTKYYYKIEITSSLYYSIVYYAGSYSSAHLYVTSDYKDLEVKMTEVNRGKSISLPTSSGNKYFYIKNIDYYPHSSYLYFYLEDKNFSLNYNNITYCSTNTNPYNNLDTAINGCSFNSLSYYDPQYSSGSTIYHYKFSISSSYTYSIVNYEGNSSFGSLYVFCDYKSTSSEDNLLSTGAIIGIVSGSIGFLAILVIIIYCCCRKKKKDFMPVTQPNYVDPNSLIDPSNQTNSILPPEKTNIPLQIVPMANEAN